MLFRVAPRPGLEPGTYGLTVRSRNHEMTRNLTREELYELVWAKPMTHVAKQLGVSDLMLGKLY